MSGGVIGKQTVPCSLPIFLKQHLAWFERGAVGVELHLIADEPDFHLLGWCGADLLKSW